MNKDEEIAKLKKLWMNGYAVRSTIAARDILRTHPDEMLVLIILGNALTALDRFDEAIEIIQKAIQLALPSEMYHALVTMAFTYYEKGAYKEAENLYTRAFLDHTPRPVDQVFYAECLIKSGKYLDAIKVLTKSISENDTDYFILGVAYRALENYDDALKCFLKALDIDDDNVSAHEAAEDLRPHSKDKGGQVFT